MKRQISFVLAVNSLLCHSLSVSRPPIGRISSLDRSKLDNTADTVFYQEPKLVTHTDEGFIQQLQDLYAQKLTGDNLKILDFMSSHVSHLPKAVLNRLDRLDVHGMNAHELELNPARQATNGTSFLRDLNAQSNFIGLCNDETYDALLCCVGIQYLQQPEAVLADAARILRPGGVIIVSFTNRFFYQKALQGWLNRGMKERGRLVQDYLRAAGAFDNIQVVGEGTTAWAQLSSLAGIGGDPFVAVAAERSE